MDRQVSKKTKDANEIPNWFPLDVAGLIYPAARTRNWNCTYRVAYVLKEDVEPDLLRQAVRDLYPRFPSFFVGLRGGLFWYYWERMEETDVVSEEGAYPCRPHALFSKNTPTIRVLYYKCRIALEMPHCVTDGGGGIAFLTTLVARYLELKGHAIVPEAGIVDIHEPPQLDELIDAYKQVYTKEKLPPVKEVRSYQHRAKRIPGYLRIVNGRIPVTDLKKAAKSKGFTITEYLTAVYLYVLYLNTPKGNKKFISAQVPISLRKLYQKETLRNFSLYTIVGFDPKKKVNFTFDDIAEEIRGKIQHGASHNVVHRLLIQNTAMAKSPLLRVIPNELKRPVMRIAFRITGQDKFTAGLSNLGPIHLPDCVAAHVDQIEAVMGDMPSKRLGCAVLSDRNYTSIIFSSDNNDLRIQTSFFRFLAEQGIRVRVDSNVEGGGEYALQSV